MALHGRGLHAEGLITLMDEVQREAGSGKKNANTAFFLVRALPSDAELNFQKKGESELLREGLTQRHTHRPDRC